MNDTLGHTYHVAVILCEFLSSNLVVPYKLCLLACKLATSSHLNSFHKHARKRCHFRHNQGHLTLVACFCDSTILCHQIPEFDNLYLDMNGIIHPCSHPDDSNPHFRITEEDIFKNIFHYIEVLQTVLRGEETFP